jgi:hypothetical protein
VQQAAANQDGLKLNAITRFVGITVIYSYQGFALEGRIA